MIELSDLIDRLGLIPHDEGGYFRETFRSPAMADAAGAEGDGRNCMTVIYYLLTRASPIGHLHRNRSDIMHFFHAGAPTRYHLIDGDGGHRAVTLGPDLMQGQDLQLLVPGGVWKASEMLGGGDGDPDWSLISEAVAPGFDYRDRTLIDADELIRIHPALADELGYLVHRAT
ncbi:MAG: cupin domain-containing protein [Rhodospirillales bacterium]